VLVFVVCFVFWLLLSGHWAPLYVGLGALLSAGVAWVNRDDESISALVRALPRLVAYLPWLLKEIAVANLQVARIVLHPRLPIEPVVVRFRPPVRGDLAQTLLGNSITLTPGTITLDVDGDEFVVHALTARAGRDLIEGPMPARVVAVFAEPAG
jgi:multicomponent Na+:H+ antiporter subunit E